MDHPCRRSSQLGSLVTNVFKDKSKKGWRLEVWIRGLRRSLWLGAIPKSAAMTIRENVHALKLAAETGTQPDPHVYAWTKRVGERMANRLSDWGLMQRRATNPASLTVANLCDQYLNDARNESWSASTRSKMVEAKELLIATIGGTTLDRVTEADAKTFSTRLYETHAESTAGRKLKRARQFFNYAVDLRILERNPFAGIKATQGIDQTRKAYISEADSNRVIEKLPDQLWRTIFILARYAGLRIPSELLALEWTSIDWEAGRMKIIAPKQKRYAHRSTRIVPLFPVVRKALDELSSLANEGDRYVCESYRSKNTAQFRKPLLQAIERAGVKPWPKLYVNLRASCRSDLLKQYEPHVVNEWLGHDGAIGSAHYDRVSEADFDKANATTNTTTNKKTTKKTKRKTKK